MQTEYVLMENAFADQIIVDKHAINYLQWEQVQKLIYSCHRKIIIV